MDADLQDDPAEFANLLGKLEEGYDVVSGWKKKRHDPTLAGRQVLHRTLNELGLEVLPSHANFAMHRIQGDLVTYNRRMRERNIAVGRPFPPMLDYSRVSIGLPQEMEMWAEALKSFRQQGWG